VFTTFKYSVYQKSGIEIPKINSIDRDLHF
jgi:hypothetical protein